MNRRRLSFVVLLLVVLMLIQAAFATFSIVAVDTVTGEIGSAGASCITGSRILSDVVLGYGGIHTQAYYLAANQQYARSLMLLGVPPDAIIDSLVAHDAQNNPGIRQYGIVDYPHGQSAAYTGANCQDWKGHRTGRGYSIQGNILLGPQIVDSMEYAYLHTPGMLSDKLMAALQAAKRPGADTRCMASEKSAISSFIRVARPWDSTNAIYLDLNVNSTSGNTDPIDVLQQQYDQWHVTTAGSADVFLSTVTVARDTLTANGTDTTLATIIPVNNQGQPLGANAQLMVWLTGGAGSVSTETYIGDGMFTCVVTAASVPGLDTLAVYSLTGTLPDELVAHPIIHYVPASAVPNSSSVFVPSEPALIIFPNPFNNATTITFAVPSVAHARVAIYDLLGREMEVVWQGIVTAGSHQIAWECPDCASGIYFVVLTGNGINITRKTALIR